MRTSLVSVFFFLVTLFYWVLSSFFCTFVLHFNGRWFAFFILYLFRMFSVFILVVFLFTSISSSLQVVECASYALGKKDDFAVQRSILRCLPFDEDSFDSSIRGLGEGSSRTHEHIFCLAFFLWRGQLLRRSVGEEEVDECAREKLDLLASLDGLEIPRGFPSLDKREKRVFLHVKRSCFISLDGKRCFLGVDSRLTVPERLLGCLPDDFVPPQELLSRARDCSCYLYLRVSQLLLVDGGFEEEWKWYMRSATPSTYAAKVFPKKLKVYKAPKVRYELDDVSDDLTSYGLVDGVVKVVQDNCVVM